MKILHVNLSDRIGGASIAMSRIHDGLKRINVDSQMLVRNVADRQAARSCNDIHLLAEGIRDKVQRACFRISRRLSALQKDPTCFFCSTNLFPNNLITRINSLDPDLVNLHWVGANILKIEDLPKIGRPIVWTMQDMWSFCGAEHYDFESRWRDGYSLGTRPPTASGFDWNRHTWQRKMQAWANTAVTTVGPCQWISDCAKTSALWSGRTDCSHEVIPFGLDLKTFKPRKKSECRAIHGIEEDGKPLVLFGADRVTSPMKGMDWLASALEHLSKENFQLRIAYFGSGEIEDLIPNKFSMIKLGRIDSPKTLSEIYCAADLMVVPSRLESFGQTASEAQACGTPVVSFDTSGLKDIVIHKITGYRAKRFDPQDLAYGMLWCLEMRRLESLGEAAASNAREKFGVLKIAEQYKHLYESILST